MFKNKVGKLATWMLVLCMTVSTFALPAQAANESTSSENDSVEEAGDVPAATVEDTVIDMTEDTSEYDYKYSNYLKDHGDIVDTGEKLNLDFSKVTVADGTVFGDYNGKKSVLKLGSVNANATFNFNIAKSGYYCLYLEYCGLKDNEKKINLSLEADGQTPFFEAGSVEINRSYKNSTNSFEKDSKGNQIRPKQEQIELWQISPLFQSDGGSCYPYYLYFEKGAHTIKLTAENGGVAFAGAQLKQPDHAISYKEYHEQHKDAKTVRNGFVIQGEKATLKSSASLYPLTDRTNCATVPFSETRTVLNSIGGSNWSNPGSWVEWEFDVKTEGNYQIDLRVLQNANKGIKSYRTITINGEIPFAEMEHYGFKYQRGWYVETLSDAKGKPFMFYFAPGHYTLRMEATTGEMRETIASVKEIMAQVNSLYHSIIMVTGTTPDIYRDYNLQRAIPGIEDTLGSLAKQLDEQFENLQKISDGSAAAAETINTLTDQMRNMQKLPKTISDRVSNFYSNISAVYAWLNSAAAQSLTVDAIAFGVDENDQLVANAGVWKRMQSATKSFLYSYVSDYGVSGALDKSKPTITVWMNKGRDQAEILNQLIERSFTSRTDIQVNLKLVQAGVVEAIVAGTGPDVILNQGMYTPVDFAARGILVPLDTMEGFDELVKENLHETAMIPYEFRGHYYALPETQDFCMMFYRKDILQELNLKLPDTWDELKETMSVLSRNNMQIGLQSINTTAGGAISTEFPKNILTMFMQNHLSLYNEDLTATNLLDTKMIETFKNFAELYTKWGLPYYFDASNRFRTGEMPIMISSISTYNTLAIAAPEIAGRWGMTLVPGTVQEDGSLDRTVEFTTSSTMMFKSAKDKKSSWEFIKWWMDSETQYEYSMEIESLLGASGRNLTSNKIAFKKIPWDADISANIEAQWELASTVPMVPGYYSVSRYLTNALSDAIIKKDNAHYVIEKYATIINNELARKRKQIDALNP